MVKMLVLSIYTTAAAVVIAFVVIFYCTTIKPILGYKQSLQGVSQSPAIFLADNKKTPISVNYHFTRVCNMRCGFCFHTAKTSFVMDITKAREGIQRLKEAGMRKINFAGGEPFVQPKFLGQMIDYCKEIGVESVSIVSNGSKVTEAFLREHGRNIDILAISCDSFDEKTNIDIGRGTGNNVKQLYRIKGWCETFGISFKINTVICKLNWQEDMNAHITALSPSRWKVFQVLIVEGENDSEERLRDGTKYTITKDQFEHFVERHKDQAAIVPEPNDLMATTYLILDEYMRFLDRTGKEPSKCILDVSVEEALSSVHWDTEGFIQRGGLYDWTAHGNQVENAANKDLEW